MSHEEFNIMPRFALNQATTPGCGRQLADVCSFELDQIIYKQKFPYKYSLVHWVWVTIPVIQYFFNGINKLVT